MIRLALALAGLCLAVAPAARAQEDASPPPDPVAIARASAEFLAGREAFAFRWFASFDEMIDGREKLTFVRSGENRMVRGTGFVSFTERGDGYRDYYHDGRTFTVASHEQNFYASAPFEGGFEDLIDAVRERTGSVLPLWSIMSARLPERFLAGVEGAAYVGETLIAGQPAHHLAFTTYEEDWQVWIATDPEAPLPLMLVGTDPYLQGWPQYRAYFTDWDLDPDRDPAQFVFVPDEDDLPASMPDLLARAHDDSAATGARTTPPADVAEETDEADETDETDDAAAGPGLPAAD